MYAICSVVTNDVVNAVKEMVKNGYKFPVYQFPEETYTDLQSNNISIMDTVAELDCEHVINMTSRVVHNKECTNLRNAKLKVAARLVDISTTGLKTCRACMK
jgi:hypothetical protein